MLYRISQVWRLQTRRLDREQSAWVRGCLSPGQFALFRAQQPGDQVHAFHVARTLESQGYAREPLIVAALLHDCGKAPGVPLFHRTLIVLLKRFAPRFLRGLHAAQSGLLGPLARAWHHAALGAALAESMNAAPDAVAIIRYHQHPDPPVAPALRPLIAALKSVDDTA